MSDYDVNPEGLNAEEWHKVIDKIARGCAGVKEAEIVRHTRPLEAQETEQLRRELDEAVYWARRLFADSMGYVSERIRLQWLREVQAPEWLMYREKPASQVEDPKPESAGIVVSDKGYLGAIE